MGLVEFDNIWDRPSFCKGRSMGEWCVSQIKQILQEKAMFHWNFKFQLCMDLRNTICKITESRLSVWSKTYIVSWLCLSECSLLFSSPLITRFSKQCPSHECQRIQMANASGIKCINFCQTFLFSMELHVQSNISKSCNWKHSELNSWVKEDLE